MSVEGLFPFRRLELERYFVSQFMEIIIGTEFSPFLFRIFFIQTLAERAHNGNRNFFNHPVDSRYVGTPYGKGVIQKQIVYQPLMSFPITQMHIRDESRQNIAFPTCQEKARPSTRGYIVVNRKMMATPETWKTEE